MNVYIVFRDTKVLLKWAHDYWLIKQKVRKGRMVTVILQRFLENNIKALQHLKNKMP